MEKKETGVFWMESNRKINIAPYRIYFSADNIYVWIRVAVFYRKRAFMVEPDVGKRF